MPSQNCPYCGIGFSLDGVSHDYSFPKFEKFHPYATGKTIPAEFNKQYTITSHRCPECMHQIMWLQEHIVPNETLGDTVLLFPKRPIKLLPKEIPGEFSDDFREAHDTLEISPKASAALSRRCLQHLIREKEKINHPTLVKEVEALLALNKLPKPLADELDAIRNIGNFAAHPIKDTNTGEIVDVEPGEAEWTLQVLEDLLNFYFVDSAKSQARRDALNAKLKAAGKKEML